MLDFESKLIPNVLLTRKPILFMMSPPGLFATLMGRRRELEIRNALLAHGFEVWTATLFPLRLSPSFILHDAKMKFRLASDLGEDIEHDFHCVAVNQPRTRRWIDAHVNQNQSFNRIRIHTIHWLSDRDWTDSVWALVSLAEQDHKVLR